MESTFRSVQAAAWLAAGAALLLLSGCGEAPVGEGPIAIAAEQAFNEQGFLKEDKRLAFLAMEGDPKVKIDVMVEILARRQVMRHPGATEVIAEIDHPARVDALMKILDTYNGPRDIEQQVRSWAVTGLAFSAEPRAFKKLFELLDTSEDELLLGAILHDLGYAPRNAKDAGKELPDELFEEIQSNVEKCRTHEVLSVREHAERALARMRGELDDI